MHRLDHNADAAFESVNGLFAEVLAAVERRREEVLAEVRRRKDEKRKVLEEQLKIIQTEKAQVDKDVEVRDRERDSLFRISLFGKYRVLSHADPDPELLQAVLRIRIRDPGPF